MLRMTDFRLLATKHGRVMIPLIMVIIALAIVRVVSDELVVQQIYGIGVMLLEIAITLYALDAVLRLTGACDDRLLLLSPLSRWRLAVCNMLVLPVTVIGLGDQVNSAFFFIAANMLLGIIVWLSAFMLSRRKNNFIRL